MYVLRAELDAVREQIHAPEEEILPRYCLMTRAARADRVIVLVEEPPELACIAALASNAAVLLPGQQPGTYDRLAAVDPWPPQTWTLTGKIAPWPSKPIYMMDRAQLERLRGA